MDSPLGRLTDLPMEQEKLNGLLLEMNTGQPLYVEVSDYCGRDYLAEHLPEDMIRILQAYTRKPAEPIFQQPRKKTAFEKHPSVSRPPSESSIWLRKTATVCTPSPCTP